LLVGDGQQAQSDASVPVIKPDEKPIKTRPEDRGGMEVPNQDKLVYQDVGKGDNQGEASSATARLMPPAEKPEMPATTSTAPQSTAAASAAMPPAAGAVPPPPAVAGPDTAVATAPISSPAAPAPEPAPTAAQVVPAPAPPPIKPMPDNEARAARPQQLAAAAPAPAPEPMKRAAAAGSGTYQVQLAAMRSEADARAAWRRALAANKELLSGLSEEVVRADLGAKGVYYRLRAGPLDAAAAKTLCAELVKRKQVCIVARKS